jgi:hypothetical protein
MGVSAANHMSLVVIAPHAVMRFGAVTPRP